MIVLDSMPFNYQPGKVVCVGRNYAEHAKELNNPVPSTPLLFIKPATSLVAMAGEFRVPTGQGDCHIETEIALLVGEQITNADPSSAWSRLAGIGLGYDLTLRDLQTKLKEKGHPWERAKAFDASCPISEFVPIADIDEMTFGLQLTLNGELQQSGTASEMITSMSHLLAHISQTFTLMPGDIVLTGTPAGVCAIKPGDQLSAQLTAKGEVLLAQQSVVV